MVFRERSLLRAGLVLINQAGYISENTGRSNYRFGCVERSHLLSLSVFMNARSVELLGCPSVILGQQRR